MQIQNFTNMNNETCLNHVSQKNVCHREKQNCKQHPCKNYTPTEEIKHEKNQQNN